MARNIPPQLIHQTMHGFVYSNPSDFVKFFRECFGDYAESLGLVLLAKYWTKQGNHLAREVIPININSTLATGFVGNVISLDSNVASSAQAIGDVVGTLTILEPNIYTNPNLNLDDPNGFFGLSGLDIVVAGALPIEETTVRVSLQVQGVGTRFHAVRKANAPDVDRVIGDGLEVIVPNQYRVIAADRTCQTRRFRIRIKDYSLCQSKIEAFYELVRIYFPHALLVPDESDSDIQLQQADIVIDLKEMVDHRANRRRVMYSVG